MSQALEKTIAKAASTVQPRMRVAATMPMCSRMR